MKPVDRDVDQIRIKAIKRRAAFPTLTVAILASAPAISAAAPAIPAAPPAIPAPAAARGCAGDATPPSELLVKEARAAVLCLINQRRRANGVGGLLRDRRLVRAAQRHSNAMEAGDFFSHTGLDGSSPQSRIERSGYLSGAISWGIAENISWGQAGRGSPRGAVTSWMRSPPHRAALLSGSYRDLGVGVAIGSPTGGSDPNSAIYTADFGYRN